MEDSPSGQLQGTLNGIQLAGFVPSVNNHAVLTILILWISARYTFLEGSTFPTFHPNRRDENLPLFRGFPLFWPKFVKINCFRFVPICSNLVHFEWGYRGFPLFWQEFLFFEKNPVLIPAIGQSVKIILWLKAIIWASYVLVYDVMVRKQSCFGFDTTR